ncbi:unnamed protein product [Microthlaspi erraticum]|uniref:Uncharacterized protein n=1 Tax=Microthlaspi erraticum TaxID=1685480 RepID=A0A6D2L1P5_9BRAS|nr:unnamed protein product [Microthlaspi erraticum]
MEKGAKEPQTMIHASFQVKSIILSPSDNSRYRAGTKLRKFGRERRSSRRPKVTILIWKDRYLSHASRRSGMKPFGSTIRAGTYFLPRHVRLKTKECRGFLGLAVRERSQKKLRRPEEEKGGAVQDP